MAKLALGLCALLVLGSQDEAVIKGLIEQLDADGFDERDKAQDDLLKIGSPAIPHLKRAIAEAGDRAELRVRATKTLETLEFNEQAKSVYREPKVMTLDVTDQPLREVLDSLSKTLGITFETGAVDAGQKITLKRSEASLFEILDGLCASQGALSYEHKEAGKVTFLKERRANCPSAYAGPFCIRITELSVERKNSFKGVTASLRLSMDTDYEKYLKPSKPVRLEIIKALDDKNARVDLSQAGDDGQAQVWGGGGAVVVRVGVMGQRDESQWHFFTARNLSPEATRLTIHGMACFPFPLEPRVVSFEDGVKVGSRRESGDYVFEIVQGSPKEGEVWLSISRLGAKTTVLGIPQDDVTTRMDADSMVAVDGDGKEYKADSFEVLGLHQVRRINPVMNHSFPFCARFPGLKMETVKTLRFKFADRTFEKKVHFELKDVDLP